MQITMYDTLVPTANRMLGNLSNFLDKAEVFAAAKKIDAAVLLNSRLAPDMLPLTRQVQIAADMSKGAAGRLLPGVIADVADRGCTTQPLPSLKPSCPLTSDGGSFLLGRLTVLAFAQVIAPVAKSQ